MLYRMHWIVLLCITTAILRASFLCIIYDEACCPVQWFQVPFKCMLCTHMLMSLLIVLQHDFKLLQIQGKHVDLPLTALKTVPGSC